MSSLFQISGQLLHVYEAPTGETKDGETYGGGNKIQIIGELPLPNGETKLDMITLSYKGSNIQELRNNISKDITAPIGIFASKGGNVTYYIPKGAEVAF